MDAIYLMKREMLRRKYSLRTIKSYSYCLNKFLLYFKDKNPRKLTKRDVKDFIDYNLIDKNRAGSTVNLYFNAIKFLMENILNKKLMYSAGLRVSELVSLKVKDLEFSKNYGWVRQGKGRKDRLFIIAKSLNEELQKF